MTYRNPNRSGYRFIGSKGDRLPIDPLVVGSFKMFESVNSAIANSEFKGFVRVKIVRSYTNVYVFKKDKFDDVLLFLKNIIE